MSFPLVKENILNIGPLTSEYGKEITEDVRYKNDNMAMATKDELNELLNNTKEVHLSR